MNSRVADALALLPEYLGWHVLLSASALALGVNLGSAAERLQLRPGDEIVLRVQ